MGIIGSHSSAEVLEEYYAQHAAHTDFLKLREVLMQNKALKGLGVNLSGLNLQAEQGFNDSLLEQKQLSHLVLGGENVPSEVQRRVYDALQFLPQLERLEVEVSGLDAAARQTLCASIVACPRLRQVRWTPGWETGSREELRFALQLEAIQRPITWDNAGLANARATVRSFITLIRLGGGLKYTVALTGLELWPLLSQHVTARDKANWEQKCRQAEMDFPLKTWLYAGQDLDKRDKLLALHSKLTKNEPLSGREAIECLVHWNFLGVYISALWHRSTLISLLCQANTELAAIHKFTSDQDPMCRVLDALMAACCSGPEAFIYSQAEWVRLGQQLLDKFAEPSVHPQLTSIGVSSPGFDGISA